jgi:cytochrome c oxidase cbb3-type subunit I
MESLVTRTGLWLLLFVAALLMAANALDTGYGVHMTIFALAALTAMIAGLRGADYQLLGRGAAPPPDQARYDDDLIRWGVILTTFWGVTGFLVGLYIAMQLAYPALNLGLEYTTFGRLRPLHTSAVIFAFGGTALNDIETGGDQR